VATATTVVHHDFSRIHVRYWVYLPIACVAIYFMAAIAQTAFAIAPLDLTVRPEGSQIRIAWNRAATTKGAVLDVIDGGAHTAIFVPAALSTVTYQASSSDVEVRLAPAGSNSPEIARCLVREAESTVTLDREMAATMASAAALRTAIRRGRVRINELQKRADKLIASMPPPRREPVVTARTPTAWWR